MKYTEEAAWFSCADSALLSIVAKPEVPANTGVVVVVGGPQYRAGSHRQFVLLSRTLAAAGYPVLRFDYRGMGDSEGTQRDFQAVSADIAAAIDALQQSVPAVQHVALWGLCDGASAALLYCFDTHDPRVTALCLFNPWVRSETSLARTRVKHYYTQRIVQKEFWVKLLRGQVAFYALGELSRSVLRAFTGPARTAATPHQLPFQQRMAHAFGDFAGRIFLLLSDDDYTAKEFLEYANKDPVWTQALRHPRLLRHHLPGADHTFSSAAYRAQAEDLTLRRGLPGLRPSGG